MRRILPKAEREVLRQFMRIAAAAAIGEADVEQAEVRAVRRRCERIERDLAAVVVRERLREADQLRGAPPS